MTNLNKFFNPKSVAIIGASREPGKIGYVILSNFIGGKYRERGEVYPINPNAKGILGKKAYKSVLDVPASIDLAVIVVPAKIVPMVLKECVQKRIPAVIIITAGFSEIGEKGAELEEELRSIVACSGTRIIGPNCVGIYDSSSRVDTLFLSRERCGRPEKGNISFISQSGAVGSTILDWLANEKVGISKFISYGNAMDIDDSDLVEYLGRDKSTSVVMVYLEGIEASGSKFLKITREISKRKPVVILKAGKTRKGQEAVSSHTGSLAGSGKVYSGAFKQAGVIEADNWEELLDFSIGFSTQPLPKGNRIVIITDGGGFGVLATDEAERQGLKLPEPSKGLKTRLLKKMPHYVSLHNPIDLTGDADGERYRIAIEECLKSEEYDGVIAIILFQVPTLEKEVVDYLIQLKKKYKKPLLACAAGGKFTRELSEKLVLNGVPVYPTPERVVKAMSALVEY